MRLIDADKLKYDIDYRLVIEAHAGDYESIKDLVDDQPTVDATEKQTPQKPVELTRLDGKVTGGVCECGRRSASGSPFCWFCGQRMDWSDEKD